MNFQNRRFFGKKKSKSHQVADTFFEATSEAMCPQLVLHVLCCSRVHLSRVKRSARRGGKRERDRGEGVSEGEREREGRGRVEERV